MGGSDRGSEAFRRSGSDEDRVWKRLDALDGDNAVRRPKSQTANRGSILLTTNPWQYFSSPASGLRQQTEQRPHFWRKVGGNGFAGRERREAGGPGHSLERETVAAAGAERSNRGALRGNSPA